MEIWNITTLKKPYELSKFSEMNIIHYKDNTSDILGTVPDNGYLGNTSTRGSKPPY